MAKNSILVFSESLDVMTELLGAASTLAGADSRATVIATGVNAQALRDEGLARGADVLVVPGAGAETDDSESLAAALEAAIRDSDPAVVLAGATRSGAEAIARAAQRLRVPYVSNCNSLALDDEGNLRIERRVYGGRLVARQVLRAAPRIVTVPAKRFAAAEKVVQPQGSVREIVVEMPRPRVKTLSASSRSRSQLDITKAEIIVSAGRGVRKMEDLRLLEELAEQLGGVLAGTRPLTGDVDWLPMDRRIGLSGQTVKPNLYIACGVSGQIEHIVGMKGARTVVAVNNDAKAPIHVEADYSVIGDLYEIVPALSQACKTASKTS